jgi:two-component system CheB/CheR fusion protein
VELVGRSDSPAAIVGVGASAGGIEAFTALLKELPADSGLAFVLVQHLAPKHASMAEILQRVTSMRVAEVDDEPRVEPNRVYVIPPARTMVLQDGHLSLRPRDPGPHQPIDTFFQSLAASRAHRAIGIVLSGTASDGTAGLAAIKTAGGITIAQDNTALHDGMARNAIAAGSVDFVLPPAGIARELLRIATRPNLGEPEELRDEIDNVLGILRDSGVDFSQYKSSTLCRHIRRRMILQKVASLADYVRLLSLDPHEVASLYHDILIGVAKFFRDPEAFETLKTNILPRLFHQRDRNDPVRVWVLGCSTGEEAYSLAIAFTEYASDLHSSTPIVVYATDLNPAAIKQSRAGLYPKTIATDVSPERLRRFFVESDAGYRVSKSIRDLCVFACHNVLTEPPFSRMDLIDCRNVMIYMEPVLQRRVMPLLHCALKPIGFLFLGPSETIGLNRHLFEAEDLKHKVYSKKPVPRRFGQGLPMTAYAPPTVRGRSEQKRESTTEFPIEVQREANRVLLARYVPAGVLVNDNDEVLHFRGDTGMYLAPAPGKASLNVLKMAREGLLVSLQSLLQRAKRSDAAAIEEGVRVKTDAGYHEITLAVVPVGRGHSTERCYWILFENPSEIAGDVRPATLADTQLPQGAAGEAEPPLDEKDRELARLTRELAVTRQYLQSVIEQQEAANEELHFANEELQSINEELETSREEAQSSNEELTIVNEELQDRYEELSRLNSDLNNLFGSLQMAIVMVWQDLRVRRFTPMAEKLFNLINTDIGRPIGDIKLNLDIPDLPQVLEEVIDSTMTRELEVQDKHGRWYMLRVRPYRTLDNKIDGAIILLFDIDCMKETQNVLKRQARLLEQAHEAVMVRELTGEIVYWNRGAEVLYGFSAQEVQGKLAPELEGKSRAMHAALTETLAREGHWSGELTHRTKDGREIDVESRQVLVEEGSKKRVLATNRDITDRKQLEAALHRRVDELALADRRKSEFLAMLAHELRNPLASLRNAIAVIKSAAPASLSGERAIELIDRQVSTLTRLVDDLLDVARINRGQIQLRKDAVELQTVLSRALETTRGLMEARRLELSVLVPPSPLVLQADATRLEQVFSNLLNNAAKYTQEAGEISLVMELVPPEGPASPGQAAVRVRDTGVGIGPEMLHRVFDLFTQADRSLAHSQGGLGIGLSLVRSLVELHGGRVTAHSEGPGRGSEFVVYLPLDPRDQQHDIRGDKPPSSGKPRRDGS